MQNKERNAWEIDTTGEASNQKGKLRGMLG